jgi:cytoskeletal protein CcmA (bactofilin family)
LTAVPGNHYDYAIQLGETMSEIQIKGVDESEIDTVLAEDIDFQGTLSFNDSLMIKGRFTGDIDATGDLYVDSGAVIEASVQANVVSLKGTIRGNVEALSRVELFSTSTMQGDITAPNVIMESGCKFNGICKMEKPT